MLAIIIKKIKDTKLFKFFKTMHFRITVMCFAIILFALFFMGIYIQNVVRSSIVDDKTTDMFMKANIISELINEKAENPDEEIAQVVWENLSGTGMRAVIINNSYKIIYDSNEDRPSDGLFVREVVTGALQGRQQSEIKNSNLTVCVPMKEGGCVYLEQDIDGTYRIVKRIGFSFVMFSIIMSVFVVLLSMVISYMITSPLKVFIQAAAEISKGNFGNRIKIKGTTEIKEMAQTMNYMCAELEHIDEKRRKFVSDASHELKTPMATIKLICDTIVSAENPDMAMVSEFLNDLSEEVDRLTRIVDRLLTLTRMDSDKVEFKPELTDYGMLVKRIQGKIQPKAAERNIIINCDVITEEMQPVFIDDDKIWEALYNIVDNAVKYSKIGAVVRIEVYVAGNELVTKITDDGPGIPDEFKERIFERFYRIDDSRARNTGGTGLGLAITKEMIAMHNGKIRVLDAEGGGSIFEVVIPYKTGSDIQAASIVQPAANTEEQS